MMTAKMMEILKTAGIAKEWHKGDMHRLYIEISVACEMYFDNSECFESGNIAVNRYEKDNGKVWVDMESGEIHTKGIRNGEKVISQIMELVAFLTPVEATETAETTEITETTEEERTMKKYQVIGGQYESKWYGESDTLRGAKCIATRHEEYWDNWQGWHKPAIYAREDVKEIESRGRITTSDGMMIRVPRACAEPVC